MSFKRAIVSDTIKYSIANYLSMAMGVMMSIGMKIVLGATGSGYWAVMKIVTSYSEYTDLGVKDAMLREVPQARGQGDEVKATTVQNAVFSFCLVSSTISALIICLFSRFCIVDEVFRFGLYAVALYVISLQMYNFYLILLRTTKKVTFLSILIVANICIVAVLAISGAVWRGVVGLAMGFFAGTIISVFIAASRCGFKIQFQWTSEISRLIKIGSPLVVLSYLLVTFLSVDAMIIAKFLGVTALGYYTIAQMSVQQVCTLGRFVHIILFPHIQESYGRSGSLEAAKTYFMRTTKALVHLSPVVIAVVYFFVPPLVHHFLAKFEPGIPAMRILIVGYFFMVISEMGSTILFTVDKQSKLLPVYALCAGLGGLMCFLAVKYQSNIQSVAIGMSVAYVVFFLSIFFSAFSLILSKREKFTCLRFISLVFLYFCLALLAADKYVTLENIWFEATAKYLLFNAIYLPILWNFEKEEKIITVLTTIIHSKFQKPTEINHV